MYFYIYIIFYIDKCKSIALYSFFFCIATNGVESLNISNQIFVTITGWNLTGISRRYTKKDMETPGLQRAVKFKYIRHPPWILGLHRYILNVETNGAVYITRILSGISV